LPPSSLRPGQGPHSGGDTYDLIDHALHQLAERRGAWLGDDLFSPTKSPVCSCTSMQLWSSSPSACHKQIR
jgi:hypothetical protein